MSWPTTYLIQRLPIGKYLPAVIVVWGAIVAATAGCKSYGSLTAIRILLGMTESTMSPAFVYLTSMWYTRDEIPARTGVWFAGNSLGGFIASLLAFGIGHIKQPLTPWQWLFIIFGISTSIWGVFMFFLLPSDIASAKFLTEEEKEYAENRVVVNGTGRYDATTSKWKLDQVIECFMDPKTYFFIAIEACTQIPNGGTNSFGQVEGRNPS